MAVFQHRLVSFVVAVNFDGTVITGNDQVKNAVVGDVIVVHAQHTPNLLTVRQLPLVQRCVPEINISLKFRNGYKIWTIVPVDGHQTYFAICSSVKYLLTSFT